MSKEATQFKSGEEWTGNANGRPKGSISLKDKVRNFLEEHPEEVEEIVKHFVKSNRELMWQMLEGRPASSTDITSGGEKLVVNLVQFDDPDNPSQSTS